MSYKVVISERARQMLSVHIRVLAQVHKMAATQMIERFNKSLRSLQTMPQKYPFLNDDHIPPNRYHKMNMETWLLVLFQIKDDTVYVEHVLDCRKDYEWLLY